MISTSNYCYITFIIGNGFDLGLGMNTKYTDVYDAYVESPSHSKTIARFKSDLKENSANNYKNWSDFEIGLAEYAKNFTTEAEMVECVRDFKGCMVKHLNDENKKMSEFINDKGYNARFVKELNRSLEMFYDGLIPNDMNLIKNTMKGSIKVRHYISFNYTSTLEMFLALKKGDGITFENEPIHIHGKLGNEVVLGVDNLEQLKDVSFPITRKGSRAFVKPFFNEQFDRVRLETAKKTILQSDIICVYGFSMGDTDKMWVELLSAWLLEKQEHQLVIYQYEDKEYHNYNYDEIMDIEEEKKIQLLDKLGINDRTILEQIHIPVGRKIFDFNFVKTTSGYRTVGSMR